MHAATVVHEIEARRLCPRVDLETLCTEIAGGLERPALVVDASATGLRLERPYEGGQTPEAVQLELEIPGTDVVMWALGYPCFERVHQVRGALWRSTGVRIVRAAGQELRILREYVWERRRAILRLADAPAGSTITG